MKQPLTLASLVLALTGLILSAYLTWVHYEPGALVCGTGGCEVVQQSKYSEMFGIPIAILGLLMFAALLVLIVIRELRPQYDDISSTLILMMLVAALLYWAFLTYIELNVLYAVCQWCVATSIATVLLLVVEAYRWYQGYKRIGYE